MVSPRGMFVNKLVTSKNIRNLPYVLELFDFFYESKTVFGCKV